MLIISIPQGDAHPECPLCPKGHGKFTHIRSKGKRGPKDLECVFPHKVSKAGACVRCRNALGGIDVYTHRGQQCPLSLEEAGTGGKRRGAQASVDAQFQADAFMGAATRGGAPSQPKMIRLGLPEAKLSQRAEEPEPPQCMEEPARAAEPR